MLVHPLAIKIYDLFLNKNESEEASLWFDNISTKLVPDQTNNHMQPLKILQQNDDIDDIALYSNFVTI